MKKMNFSLCFLRKEFYAENIKTAYLDACKWFASNVLASNLDSSRIFAEYEKQEELDCVVLKVHAVLDETKEFKNLCEVCKAMHSSFFINENTECSRCTAGAYRRRLEQRLKIKSQYVKEVIENGKAN